MPWDGDRQIRRTHGPIKISVERATWGSSNSLYNTLCPALSSPSISSIHTTLQGKHRQVRAVGHTTRTSNDGRTYCIRGRFALATGGTRTLSSAASASRGVSCVPTPFEMAASTLPYTVRGSVHCIPFTSVNVGMAPPSRGHSDSKLCMTLVCNNTGQSIDCNQSWADTYHSGGFPGARSTTKVQRATSLAGNMV